MLRSRDLTKSSGRPHVFVFRLHREYLRSHLVIVDMYEVNRFSPVRPFRRLVRCARIFRFVMRGVVRRGFRKREVQDRFELHADFVGDREYREGVPFCVGDRNALR